jgi:hypothetical protein
MSEPDNDLMTRLHELVGQHGNQWRQIAPILAAEGYQDGHGNPYSHHALRKRMAMKRAGDSNAMRSASSTGCSELSEHVEPRTAERSTSSVPSPPDVRQLAYEVVEILRDEGILAHTPINTEDREPRMPPQPERITDRKWEKLAGTCDRELVKIFHDHRRELRLSVSQMLDYVLWNFFHCPPLSFQSGNPEVQEAGDEG